MIPACATVEWLTIGRRNPPRQIVQLRKLGMTLRRHVPGDPAGGAADALLVACREPGAMAWSAIADHARSHHGAVLLISDASGEVRAYLLQRGVADIVDWHCCPIELAARLVLRIAQAGRTLRIGILAVDPVRLRVQAGDRDVPMPLREAAVLAYLLRHRHRAVSAGELRRAIWKQDFDPGTNSVAVHLSRLRSRVAIATGGTVVISTSWGSGYRIDQRDSTPAMARMTDTAIARGERRYVR